MKGILLTFSMYIFVIFGFFYPDIFTNWTFGNWIPGTFRDLFKFFIFSFACAGLFCVISFSLMFFVVGLSTATEELRRSFSKNIFETCEGLKLNNLEVSIVTINTSCYMLVLFMSQSYYLLSFYAFSCLAFYWIKYKIFSFRNHLLECGFKKEDFISIKNENSSNDSHK